MQIIISHEFKDEKQIINTILLQLGTRTVGINTLPDRFLKSDQHFGVWGKSLKLLGINFSLKYGIYGRCMFS